MKTQLTKDEKRGLAIIFNNETHAGEFDGWHMQHEPTRELIDRLIDLKLATSTFHELPKQQYSYCRVALTEKGIKEFDKARAGKYHELPKESPNGN